MRHMVTMHAGYSGIIAYCFYKIHSLFFASKFECDLGDPQSTVVLISSIISGTITRDSYSEFIEGLLIKPHL